MRQQLSRATLKKILQTANIETLSYSHLLDLFLNEAELVEYIPDGVCQVDPRNGDLVVFHSARAQRPHDNHPDGGGARGLPERDCIICQGKTTGVVDVADLSEGFTFINKNLFPILYPEQKAFTRLINRGENHLGPNAAVAHGLHFLQWTSSLHEKDWHNMPLVDRVVVMKRLAVLEKILLERSASDMPVADPGSSSKERFGYVSILKNYGRLVGGSLVHGHQQIGLSNVMPRSVHDHWQFKKDHEETFSGYLLRENPADLTIRDYGKGVLMVPYFMRRPYDMFFHIKDTNKQYLHELNDDEIAGLADGWHDAIRVILTVMPQIGRERAYNVITHNGPGAGLYFEFLPYTQETGGFEHLGLYLCQGNPHLAADYIRTILLTESG